MRADTAFTLSLGTMGRLDPTYSDVQREAIARAINDDGLTAAEVAHLATAGELAELPPFELPHSTAHDIAAKERTATAPPRHEGDERERLTKLVDDGLTMLEGQVAEIKQRQEKANGDLQPADLTRLEKVARVVRELAKMSDAIREQPPVQPASPPNGNGSDSPSLLEQMQRDLEASSTETNVG